MNSLFWKSCITKSNHLLHNKSLPSIGLRHLATLTPTSASEVPQSSNTANIVRDDKKSKQYPICELYIMGYIPPQVEFYSQFARQAAQHLNLPTKYHRLPSSTRRWTILKSPFKYKKFQETYQRITLKRCIKVYNANPQVVSNWVKYIQHNAPAGIGMKVVRFDYEDLNCVKTMEEEAKNLIQSGKIPENLVEVLQSKEHVEFGRDIVKELHKTLQELSLAGKASRNQ